MLNFVATFTPSAHSFSWPKFRRIVLLNWIEFTVIKSLSLCKVSSTRKLTKRNGKKTSLITTLMAIESQWPTNPIFNLSTKLKGTNFMSEFVTPFDRILNTLMFILWNETISLKKIKEIGRNKGTDSEALKRDLVELCWQMKVLRSVAFNVWMCPLQ